MNAGDGRVTFSGAAYFPPLSERWRIRWTGRKIPRNAKFDAVLWFHIVFLRFPREHYRLEIEE